ncbi:MAG TPA: Cof-type HAD-IIB family hydrolase [Aggregatilineales bacterium]|nr:Cof-type HAD-IIB family hydrolase [Aggregatilineales bacterium]
MTNDIRLLIVDIDGTLVGGDLEVRPRVREAIGKTRERGVHVALCTGRPSFGSRHYLTDLNLTGFHIFDAGATISDPLAGKTLYRHGIERQLAHEILDYARKTNVYLEIYGDEGYFIERSTELSRMHADLQRTTPAEGDLAAVIDRIAITKMEAVAGDDPESARAQALLDHFSDRIDYGWAIVPGMSVRFVNLLAKGISKGDAVRRLIAHFGLDKAQTLGIGDGPNDEPLLRAVGVGVAMGNGVESLKRLATWVAPSVDEDGLAATIDRYVLNGKRP